MSALKHNSRRWQQSLPLVFIIMGSLAILNVTLAIAGEHYRIALALSALFGLWLFIARPAVGISVALILYLPDQLLTAVTGISSVLSPGRIAVGLGIASSIPLIVSRRIFPKITAKATALMFALVIWYWIALIANYELQGLDYVFQLSLLAVFSFAAVAVLSEEHTARVICAAQAIVGGIAAVGVLAGVGAVSSGADVRVTYASIGINAISIMLGTSVIAGVAYFHIGRNRLVQGIILVAAALMLLAIARTGTRSVLLGVPLVVVGAYVVASGKGFPKYLWIACLVSVIAMAGLVFMVQTGFVEGALAERVRATWVDPSVYSNNARVGFWQDALDWYSAHPWGTGPGAHNEVSKALTAYGSEAHNTFISTLLQVNLIGLLLLLGALFSIARKALRIPQVKYRLPAVMMVMYLLLQAMKGSALQTRLFWFPLIFVLIFIEVGWAKEEPRFPAVEKRDFGSLMGIATLHR